MDFATLYMFLGFSLAAWSVIANDSIQTLGTFLSANKDISWWKLWFAASSVLIITLSYGWYINEGDLSFGRLDSIPWITLNIWHVIAPLSLLILTRFGIPVSTTFLVLSVFAQGIVIESMILKSVLGYGLASIVAFSLWFIISKFINEHEHMETNKEKSFWRIMQWIGTGLLWSTWLMHDMANIAVYLPRTLSLEMLGICLIILVLFLGIIFFKDGGKIQDIVLSKTGTRYIRSATIINFIFAAILFFFKEMNSVPMSTTWVFVGLLAGRELAISYQHKTKQQRKMVFPMLTSDFLKVIIGLVISILIAFLAANL